MQDNTAREPKTVLILEDSPTCAFAIGQLLKANGLRVKYAMDGLDGFRMALAMPGDRDGAWRQGQMSISASRLA